MSEDKSEKNYLNVRFKTPPTYRTYAADGAVAGEMMDDKIILEFYVHKQDLPEYLVFELDKKGQPKPNPEIKKGFSGLTRERQCGLVMSIDKIVSLRDELNKILDRPNVKASLEGGKNN